MSSIRNKVTQQPWLERMEEKAREVQLDLYRNRAKIWGVVPSNLADIFDAGVALDRRGYRIETVDSLGFQTMQGQHIEIVATLHSKKKLVEVAAGFSVPVLRFTMAHELGHSILHPDIETLHRDFPLDKAGLLHDRREIEANQFASCFLMPRKTVINQFQECFGLDHMAMDQETAFALFGIEPEKAWFKFKSLRHISDYVAKSGSFGGRVFRPLYSQFKVSPSAMAIRLEELKLVSGWSWQ